MHLLRAVMTIAISAVLIAWSCDPGEVLGTDSWPPSLFSISVANHDDPHEVFIGINYHAGSSTAKIFCNHPAANGAPKTTELEVPKGNERPNSSNGLVKALTIHVDKAGLYQVTCGFVGETATESAMFTVRFTTAQIVIDYSRASTLNIPGFGCEPPRGGFFGIDETGKLSGSCQVSLPGPGTTVELTGEITGSYSQTTGLVTFTMTTRQQNSGSDGERHEWNETFSGSGTLNADVVTGTANFTSTCTVLVATSNSCRQGAQLGTTFSGTVPFRITFF